MKKIYILFLGILFSSLASGKGQVTLSGFVENMLTGERLVGATLYDVSSGRGTVCNQYGFFNISLPAGEHRLQVSFVGFATEELNVTLKSDTLIRVALFPGYLLEEVSVKKKRNHPFTSWDSRNLSLEWVKQMPSVLGETDVFKALHFLPGVNPGQEGLAGFSVRGGSPEHTQFLLDGLPVYNVNHAYGYFSAFNGDALQDVTLYVGELPARYGGALSSVLDVTMREGNRKNFSGGFHLSPVAGSVVVEGPLKRNKASFIVTGRRTWLDGLLYLGQKVAASDFSTGYNFYDLNAKVNWEINTRNHVYMSFYNSRDSRFAEWKNKETKHPDRFHFYWGNLSVSGRWNHVFNASLFSNVTLYYSQFVNNQKMSVFDGMTSQREEARSGSRLRDLTLKSDFRYLAGEKHNLHFGFSVSKKYFAPEMSYVGSLGLNEHLKDTTTGHVYTSDVYIEDNWQMSKRWTLNAGIRFSILSTGHTYYPYWQPRLALTFQAGKNTFLKASWARMQQSIHLLVNTSIGMNSDVWVPATARVAPSHSDLFSLGMYHSFMETWDLSVEGYYHRMAKIVRYRDGVRFLKDKDKSWQDYVDIGNGRAYGLDIMLKKREGALTGWVSYSISKSERKFSAINNGEWFPFEYDRRHKANLVLNYRLPQKEKWRFRKSFSLDFTYASGNYISLGKQLYSAAPFPGGSSPDLEKPEYREYIEHPNNFQMPAYHHLDLAYVLENRKPRGSSWTFSIYNVYGRKNPSIIYHKETKEGISTRCWSLLPFVPSVTWSYHF